MSWISIEMPMSSFIIAAVSGVQHLNTFKYCLHYHHPYIVDVSCVMWMKIHCDAMRSSHFPDKLNACQSEMNNIHRSHHSDIFSTLCFIFLCDRFPINSCNESWNYGKPTLVWHLTRCWKFIESKNVILYREICGRSHF